MHTRNSVSLASFWREWTPNKATSWPPWMLRSTAAKHKEGAGNPATWEPWAHEVLLPCTQTMPNLLALDLRRCNLHKVWSVSLRKAIQWELLVCVLMNWVKGGWESFFCCLRGVWCLMATWIPTWHNLHDDLASTLEILRPESGRA